MIERYLKKGDQFLDVGTGSGILTVAAARLGTGKGIGIDKNEAAVKIARRNLRTNKIKPHRFNVRTGNLLDEIEARYDLVAANILREIIAKLWDDIPRVLKNGGVFICSGMLVGNTQRIEKKMIMTGLEILEKRSKIGWVAIAAKLNHQRK
ncbi:MAG: 50S ribosomal protein L11 methyltransferase [Desulfobacterales bacterium]|jgi:ribosomal protein L11 methyltransferase